MNILTLAQIIVSLLVIVLVLVQERGGGIGGIFGAAGGGFYQTRRGLEQFIFVLTIISIVVFAVLALLNLVL